METKRNCSNCDNRIKVISDNSNYGTKYYCRMAGRAKETIATDYCNYWDFDKSPITKVVWR